ncbi:hypothetical protein [Victivallis sp. Marseille-Q1083]|uniref:hypothetical protein n=1 Tax=Victivallis sp. Marseille-Q1083 TaxID=2717288 RepID=UPI00158A571D|nr:hypothetical protein [Victivallis sp. Marseille-Q1083]
MLIGMDLAGGLLFYLLAWLVTIGILWVRELWRLKRGYDLQLSKGRLFSCDHCRYVFLFEDDSNITRCPRCNSMCILRKKKNY